MKKLLLGTVAAAALLSAPVIATAQDRMTGEAPTSRSTAGGSDEASLSERRKIDAKLDDASRPRSGGSEKSAGSSAEDPALSEGQADSGEARDRSRGGDVRNARSDDRAGERSDDRRDRQADRIDSGRRDRPDRDGTDRMNDRRDRNAARDDGRDRDRADRRTDRDRSTAARTEKSRDRDRDRASVSVSERDRDYVRGLDRTDASRDRRDGVSSGRASMRAARVESEGRGSLRQRFAASDSGAGRRVSRERLGGAPIEAGVEAPHTIAVERVPTRVVEVAPEYRDYGYFETDDDRIVIVNPRTYRVITVVED